MPDAAQGQAEPLLPEQHPPPPTQPPPRTKPLSGIKSPPPLLCDPKNLIDSWKLFKQKWTNYAILTALHEQSREYQVALLLHTLGDEALKIYNGLPFDTPDTARTVDEITSAFEKFAVGESNETYERFIFNQRKQAEGESFELYVSALRQLVKSCNYCNNCIDSLLRDRIVLGIRDANTQSALLKERNLTLGKATDICRAAENASTHLLALQSKPYAESVNKLKPRQVTPKREVEVMRCKYCDKVHPMLKSKCPAYGKTCSKCHKSNHFAIMCPSEKGRKKVHQVLSKSASESESSGDEFIDSITTHDRVKDVKCRLILPDDNEVIFQVDTGASVNVLPLEHHPSHLPLNPVKKTLNAWNGNSITPLGSYRHSVRNPVNRKKYSIEFLVVKENFTPILGLRASQALNFVTINEDKFERVLQVNIAQHDVFDRTIGSLPGKHTLRVDTNVQPVVMPDRRIPLSVRPQLKSELDRLVSLGVLVPTDEPTPWVSQLVITMKKSGELRVCIDPRELNKALLRERYTLPVLEDILHALKSSTVFSKADLAHGYWHVILDEPSSKLTTFQTCFGRYRWLRLPFGTCVSSEIFQRRLLEALDGLTGIVCVADDIIIHGATVQDHNNNLEAFLQRCSEKGIKLNKDKLELQKEAITFLGHRITKNGLEADPEKIRAVQQMPSPTNLGKLRTFIGMVNYMAKFLPDLAATMKPLTNLTKSNTPWNWSTAEQEAFNTIKNQLTSSPILAFYDSNKPLTLENDASEYGLGSVLKQDDKPIAFASRTLTDTERNYAQIEKEMLAVTFGLEKFHHYTFGRQTTVVTDHNPLVAISKKPLYKAPRRLQSMLLKTQAYDFDLIYLPGTAIPTADALSRFPLKEDGDRSVHETIHNLMYTRVKNRQAQKIREASQNDEEMIELRKTITDGWPEHKELLSPQLRQYFPYRDEMTVQDGIVLRGQRLVAPKPLRSELKSKCHAGHLGINATLRRARDALYWPGISTEVREYVETCGVCSSMPTKQTPETVISREVPERPWQRVGTDIMTLKGEQYLVTTDGHSSFFEIDHLPDMTADTVIKKLKKIFARHGIPEELTSDSGTQFTAETFKRFAEQWEFEHTMSSPGNHRSNGSAEAAVKTAKRLFKKCKAANEDPYLGLLNLRNTPNEGTDQSPAQKLFGRRTRSTLPMTDNKLLTQSSTQTKVKKEDCTATKVVHVNRHLHELQPLRIGQAVRMQPIDNSKEWKEAVVTAQVSKRSYNVQDERGRTYKRNRALIRPTKKAQHHNSRKASPVPAPLESAQPPTRSGKHLTAPATERDSSSSPPQRTPGNDPSQDTEPNSITPEDTDSTRAPQETTSNETQAARTVTRSGRVSQPPQRFKDYNVA